MADSEIDGTEPPQLDALVDRLIEGLFDPSKLQRLERAYGNAVAYGQVAAHGAQAAAVTSRGESLGDELTKVDNYARGGMGILLAHVVAHMLGVEVPPEAVRDAFKGGDQSVVARALGETVLGAMRGSGNELTPGHDGAVRMIGLVSNMVMTGWFEGIIVEWASSLGGLLHPVEEISRLARDLVDGLGMGRLMRVALRPIVHTVIATPSEWEVNKQYRPTLLSPSDAIRQFKRGNWDFPKLGEELARQGYSADRIDALVNAQDKFFSPSDVRFLVEREQWTSDQAIQHLVDQGYDQATIADVLRIEGLKLFEAHETTEATAIISAYASHDIERAQFLDLLKTYVEPSARRALYEELGELRRVLFIKHLSSTQVAACVRSGVLAYVDYRSALAREGYDDDAATALELLLRFEIDKQKTVEQHRADLEAERAAAKAERDAAAAERKAQVDADRALKRRGPLADLERAAVRGLIPFARVEEVLGADYDADTVDILVGLMEADRQTYLDQQAKADDARKRAERTNLPIGDLEQAVLDNILTIQDFTARLALLKFDPADAALLANVVAAKKQDLAAAKAKRDAADTAAKIKHIDLGRLERLVRLGARPVADYDGQLAALGFDDASRAQMDELLQLEIAKDRKADQARADAEAKLKAKGLSFDQFRRAVILGTKTVDQFNTFLVSEGFTADAVATLVAEVRLAVADAEAARRKRAAAGSGSGAPALSLSTVSRAARLGIIDPEDYQARLARDGYTADDISIEMELLATEIADVQAQRATRDALAAQTGERGLSLAQAEKAVKAGVLPLEEYRSRAASLNYTPDDIATLVALLEEELAAKQAAQAAKDAAAPAGTDQATAVAALEDAVRAGTQTLDGYRAGLEQLGLDADAVALLVGNLAADLEVIP